MATSEASPLPAPIEPVEPEPPPRPRPGFEEPAIEQLYEAAWRTMLAPKPFDAKGLLLIGTLALFILSQLGGASVGGVAVLVGVLLFHELGHYAGMRAFGYADVRMFFIPFLGAAVSGRRNGVAAWKDAVVLLLGPVPGIVLSVVLFVALLRYPIPILKELVETMLLLNAFNLLPMGGLDGGRFLQRVLFSRHRHLEVAFLVLGGLALGLYAVASSSVMLGFFAFLGLAVIPRRRRVLAAAVSVREHLPAIAPDPKQLGDAESRALFLGARNVLDEPLRSQVEPVATAMDEVLDAARRPPGALASIALLAAWAGSLLVAIVAGFLLVVANRPAEWASRVLPVPSAATGAPDAAAGVRFAAEFPNDPAIREETVPTPDGPRQALAAQSYVGMLERYTVTVVRADADIADPRAWIASLRGHLEEELGELGATVVREDRSSDGRRLDVELATGWRTWNARIVVDGPCAYRLVTSAPQSGANQQRFFDSFRPGVPDLDADAKTGDE